MKRVLVTGANGFVGRALVRRLCAEEGSAALERLTLLDTAFDTATLPRHPALRMVQGSITQPQVLAQAMEDAPQVVFHMAAITSGQAEREFALGLQVNLQATVALFEALRMQAAASGSAPRLVQASSIGVYGLPLPARIDDATPIAPTLSYGAQKRAMEILLADYSRRGWIDGRSPRLPSIVARPALPNGALSSFASDLIRELAQGRRYDCPVDAEGTLWLLSLPACVQSLLHAARIDAAALPASRAWPLPALRASVAEIVAALMRRHGVEVAQRIRYAPQPELLEQFARWPALDAATARALGFRADASIDELLERALAAD